MLFSRTIRPDRHPPVRAGSPIDRANPRRAGPHFRRLDVGVSSCSRMDRRIPVDACDSHHAAVRKRPREVRRRSRPRAASFLTRAKYANSGLLRTELSFFSDCGYYVRVRQIPQLAHREVEEHLPRVRVLHGARVRRGPPRVDSPTHAIEELHAETLGSIHGDPQCRRSPSLCLSLASSWARTSQRRDPVLAPRYRRFLPCRPPTADRCSSALDRDPCLEILTKYLTESVEGSACLSTVRPSLVPGTSCSRCKGSAQFIDLRKNSRTLHP